MQDLIDRIGTEHVERRLKIEAEHEAQLVGQGLILFNLENWYGAPWTVGIVLKLLGLYGRARRNADHVFVKQHSVAFANLPLRPPARKMRCPSRIIGSLSLKSIRIPMASMEGAIWMLSWFPSIP